MKFSRACKPEMAASDDDTRLQLHHLHLDVEKQRLLATNGHLLVSVPVEIEEHDTSGPVSQVAMGLARKFTPKIMTDVHLGANGKLICGPSETTSPSMVRPDLGEARFPPYEQVIPPYAERDKQEGTVTVGLSIALLRDLCEAIGTSERSRGISLTFPIPAAGKDMLDPIVVRNGINDALGILMPMRI